MERKNFWDVGVPVVTKTLQIKTDPEGIVNFWIGSNEKADIKKIEMEINAELEKYVVDEIIEMFDFVHQTSFLDRKWFIGSVLRANIYENRETTPQTQLLSGECTGYEIVYWFRFAGHLKENCDDCREIERLTKKP